MRVLRQPDFRNLFFGQATSTIGDRIVYVALALYVTDIGSPTDVGIVLAAATLPLVAFLAFGGVWADRLPRHRVMIITDLIRFALHAVLAALIFTDAVEIWHIVVIEALFGTAEAFFRPAYTGLVPQTVPEELIQDARAAAGTVETVAVFVGPALATALVLGARRRVGVRVRRAHVPRLRRRSCRRAPAQRRHRCGGTSSHDLREGWVEVRSRAWVWVTIVCSRRAARLLAPWTMLGPTVAEEQYGSTGVYGLLAAAIGVGTMRGSLLGFRLRPLYPMRSAILCVVFRGPRSRGVRVGAPLWLLVPLFRRGDGDRAVRRVVGDGARGAVPPSRLSRVSSYDWMGSLALLPRRIPAGRTTRRGVRESALLSSGAGATARARRRVLVRETWTMRRLDASHAGPAEGTLAP